MKTTIDVPTDINEARHQQLFLDTLGA